MGQTADTDGTGVLVTSDADAFRNALLPGDVLVYDSLSFDGGLVQWGDRIPANHASLVLDSEQLIEANRKHPPEDTRPAVRTELIEPRLRLEGVRTVTALRHRRVAGDGVPVEPVLQRARRQLGQGVFAYAQIVALAPAAILRNYPTAAKDNGALGEAMTLALRLLNRALEPLQGVPDENRLTCSEYVYRCFDDVGLSIDLQRRPLLADGRPPWMSEEQMAEFKRLYGLGGTAVTVRESGTGDPPSLAEHATPGDLWRSRDLVPVVVLHHPPRAPADPVEGFEL
ncbi:MAG: hypothetical protein JWQ99_3898 [Blastococcus sp.]|jgi:hypothetical protein|nr:hypothetical protein [Blastococcus sp.]